MDAEDARTIGRRLRQIRDARRKSLRVVAGLAGMSKTKLWRIEHGEHALVRQHFGDRGVPPWRRCGWRWTRSTSTTPAGWCSPSSPG